MITIPEIKVRIHEFDLQVLLDQIKAEWSKSCFMEIIIRDDKPDQIEFTKDWTAILTREEDLPF